MSRSEDLPTSDASVAQAADTDERVRLKIVAANPFTEIRLLDASFTALALPANTGSVEVEVNPGLYEVGFRSGEDWQSLHVIADPAAGEVSVEQPAEAPTAPKSAGLAALACEAAGADIAADGATVVIRLRPADENPASMAGLAGIDVTLIDAGETAEVAADLSPDLPCTWRFSVGPGFWRLRINEAHPRQPFEMPVTVVPDYVTHVSALLLPVGAGPCVDLERLRVRLLPPDGGAGMDQVLVEFEEAAIAALGSGRSLFGPDIDRLIDGLAGDKRLNPMLGIFAAHLCERSHDDHIAYRERLLARLAELTRGPAGEHPDVAILRLAFLVGRGGSIASEPPVLFPPILAASWRLLIEIAAKEPWLIPPGSLCERVADRLWASSLWTAWTAPPLEEAAAPATRAFRAEPPPAPAPDELAASGEKIAALLDHVELRQWFREASSTREPYLDGLAWEGDGIVTPAEAAIAAAIYPVADNEERQSRFSRLAQTRFAKTAWAENADVGAMAESLGLPATTVERALNSLAGKLDAIASDFKIKF